MQVGLEICCLPKWADLEMDSCLPRGIKVNFKLHSRWQISLVMAGLIFFSVYHN